MLVWKEQTDQKTSSSGWSPAKRVSLFLLENLFGDHFSQVIRLDFLEQPGLANLFADSLSPDDILTNIELERNISINRHQDLIIFDEIGECEPAINSLKFFAEQCPEMYICASGSNIGLLGSFPVGKVELMALHPLTFEEFLWASNQLPLTRAFEQMNMGKVAHEKLFSLLIDYYFVGGMPEAVKTWFETENDLGITQRTQRIQEVHSALLAGYERDFGKYSDKVSAQHIQAVFENVPVQLSKNIDDSVQRFKFKGVIEKKTRYRDLAGPVNWLEKCRLISKCHPVDCQPASPLKPLTKDNIFKLFLFDVGLLGHMLGVSYKEHREQKYHYKGYVAENFVQNELINRLGSPTYSWEYARSEIEFLYKTDTGDIIPVEVKSGKRTRAKSLQTYVQRYNPTATLKLIGSTGSLDDPIAKVLPLYYVSRIKTVLG